MKLTLHILANSKAIKLVVEDTATKQRWEENAASSEDLVAALDKLLKNAKIAVLSLERVKVFYGEKSSLTSVRLAKTFQQALTIAKFYQPRRHS